jgi:glycosyltransferase involved in cell wall biosynthesis
MPIAMLDAMASALPVVASDVGEIGTLIDHGRNGLLYRCGDVEALAEQLRVVLSDEERARALAGAAATDVALGFSEQYVAECYRRVFASAA